MWYWYFLIFQVNFVIKIVERIPGICLYSLFYLQVNDLHFLLIANVGITAYTYEFMYMYILFFVYKNII